MCVMLAPGFDKQKEHVEYNKYDIPGSAVSIDDDPDDPVHRESHNVKGMQC